MPNFWIIFLTGLLTGGVTCAALQGGLLATLLLTSSSEPKPQRRFRMMIISIAFVSAKLASHTLGGFFLGLAGEKLRFSVQATALILGIASLFMIGMGFSMLSVHPIFKRLVFSPPKVFRSFFWKQSKRTDIFAPVVLGALTIFIPCGVTQAMMAQAVSYGNAWIGSLILFTFTAGTIPLFLLLGLAVTTLSETYTHWFKKIAAALILVMAMWNLYNTATIFEIDRTIGRLLRPPICQLVYCEDADISGEEIPTQTPRITVRRTAYEINNPFIRASQTITLTVTNADGYGCIQFFTIPRLGIQKSVPVGKTETIVFTAPNQKGELLFTCSMGMYRGRFVVQ